jgi:hypothetical protein
MGNTIKTVLKKLQGRKNIEVAIAIHQLISRVGFTFPKAISE